MSHSTPFPASNNLRGILSMLLAGVFLVAADATMKYLVPHYPVGEILCVQALMIAILSSACLLWCKQPLLQFSNPKGHLARGLLYVAGSFAFVHALRFLPLGEVIAIAFAGPLFLTLFGKLFLREQVGPHRMLAVLAGFVGVIIMLRPGASMHWAVVLPLLVAVADALRDIVTRKTTVGESSFRIVLSTSIVLAIAGAISSLAGGWVPVSTLHLLWFVGSAAAFVTAHFALVEAFRHAQTVVVAPFRYVQLIWGIFVGWFFFDDTLDAAIFIGAALIITAGVYIVWREARQHRRARLATVN